MKHLAVLSLTISIIAMTVIVPQVSVTSSVLTYLQGASWTISSTTTWTTQGTGIDYGNYKRVTTESDTYTLTDVTSTSFTESGTWNTSESETASGSWVAGSGSTQCSACTVTTTWSGSGTLTYSLPSLTATAVSGDYTNDNIGHASADLFPPEMLGIGKQVGYYWIDQNGNYETVQYSIAGEKDLPIAGATAKTYVLQYTGQSKGLWQTHSGQLSIGQLTRTYYCDESTGVILANHLEGTFSLQRSGGGWQETFVADATVTSVSFRIGSYVFVDSNPPSAPINVDGSNVSNFPRLFIWDWGSSHTLTAPQTYTTSPGARLVFTGWDDGAASSTRTIIDKPGTYTAQFKKQYFLSVNSPYGETFGSGWYDAGATANIHADSNAMFFYDFTGWSGTVLPSNPDTQVTMTGPLILEANYSINPLRVAIVIIIVIIIAAIAGILFYHRRKSDGSVTPSVYPNVASIPVSRSNVCNSCGAIVNVGARFCRKCGASQVPERGMG